jgi:methionyl-tRNA formyltransferase
MKIVFMGTPSFAIPSLQKIYNGSHELSAIVTAPDKERGRGQKISYTPVKEFALENNIPLLQPEKLKDENFISELKKFKADLFVIVAFRILPREVFTLPRICSFNLHASLLPKYRGAAPIQWALIKGEKETGVTTFKLEEKVDTGNIFLKEKVLIEDDDNFQTLHDKLSVTGSEAVIKTIDLIDSGEYTLQPQDNSLATPAPKISKETGLINWEQPAEEIHNLIRGLSPYPGAYFLFNDKLIKIYKSKVIEGLSLSTFEIMQGKDELIIGCGKDALSVIELQQEGKKRLGIEEFLRGFSFKQKEV